MKHKMVDNNSWQF